MDPLVITLLFFRQSFYITVFLSSWTPDPNNHFAGMEEKLGKWMDQVMKKQLHLADILILRLFEDNMLKINLEKVDEISFANITVAILVHYL